MTTAKSWASDILNKSSDRIATSMKLAGIVLNNRFENIVRERVFESKKNLDRDERRRDKRLCLEKDIMFKYAYGKPAFGRILNISRRGMYIMTDVPLNCGEEINANLLWDSLGSLTSLKGHIVRRGDNGVAVRFA